MEDIRSNNKKCDYCGEEIALSARRCPYCGSLIDNKPAETQQMPIPGLNTNESGGIGDNGMVKNGNMPDVEPVSTPRQAINEDLDPIENQTVQAQSQPIAPVSDILSSAGVETGVKAPPQSNNYYNPKPVNQSVYRPEAYTPQISPMGNGTKVFLTVLSTVVPWIGQLIGIIAAIVFMNSGDKDRKSFGIALLVASLIVFVLISIFGCLAAMTFSASDVYNGY